MRRGPRPRTLRRAVRGGAAVASVLAVVVGVWLLPGVGRADAEGPISAVCALVTLAITLWFLPLGRPGAGVASAEASLRARMLETETRARQQLLRDDKVIDLAFSLHRVPSHGLTGAAPAGSLAGATDYYRALSPRRLVITGAPGAGKTVLAVELVLGLLADPGEPVPIRLPAASWDHQPVEGMLADHLVRVLKLPEADAMELVGARRVLPVLEELDEMDAGAEPGHDSRAGLLLSALDLYLNGAAKAGVVVTCRTGHYEALAAAEVWAGEAAQIEILPVAPGEALTFLERHIAADADTKRWADVLDAIDFELGPLARALSTPWRLTLAAAVYRRRRRTGEAGQPDPAELTRLPTEEAIGEHLVSKLIPAVSAYGDYSPRQVHAWLGTLAGYLNANAAGRTVGGRSLSGTDLVLHELWPVAGPRAVRVVHGVLQAATTLLAAGAMVTALVRLPFTFGGVVTLIVLLGLPVALVGSWRIVWQEPRRGDRVLIPYWLLITFGVVPVLVLAIYLVLWLVAAFVALLFTTSPRGSPTEGLAELLGYEVVIGAFVGFVLVYVEGAAGYGYTKVHGPRGVMRNDLARGAEYGLVCGLTFAMPAGAVEWLQAGPGPGIVLGLVTWFAFAAALVLGSGPGPRYVAFLLCARRWNRRLGGNGLPWRLGRFLDWCHAAGLLRTAGIAYQFRHRELQDYLAANPVPKNARG
ncbi:hypothetical protein ACWEQG_07870 [Microbispora sp. NPDC004025]